MKVNPLLLAGFCVALIVVSFLAGVQVAYYFGHERTSITVSRITTTLAVPVLSTSGNYSFSPPYPQILLGNISWNTTIIALNQTMELNESITNPSFANSTIVVPYAECISEIILSMPNGTQFYGAGSQTTTCAASEFNDTMRPGESSNVSFLVGFRGNLPPMFPEATWGNSGNSSNFEYWWPVPEDLPSSQYELVVAVYRPGYSTDSLVIPISIIA